MNCSVYCHSHCLHSAAPPPRDPYTRATPEHTDLSSVHSDYHDLSGVFSKDRVLPLPPHRPCDCSIDLLLPGATPPTLRSPVPLQSSSPWTTTFSVKVVNVFLMNQFVFLQDCYWTAAGMDNLAYFAKKKEKPLGGHFAFLVSYDMC